MVKQKGGIYFSQKEILTENCFTILELDLEFFVQEEEREAGILIQNNFVRTEEGKGIRVRINCPKKGRRREEENKSEEA